MHPKENKNECPACHGAKVQHNTVTGMTVSCPVCLGTGQANPFKRPLKRCKKQ
ncbi:MAG: hypothetical protein ACFFG0_20025 [Candidatus Thorarchaeota archaeon]